jgi:hypothetical protein
MVMGATPLVELTEPSVFAISVELVADPSADLLIMASVLHRRGVDVLEAQLSRPTGGRRVFTASFAARSARHATSVARTFEGRVGVLDVHLLTAPADSPYQRRLSA